MIKLKILPCRYEDKQLEKIAEEFYEFHNAIKAYEKAVKNNDEKKEKLRAEILFEGLDLITSVVTYLLHHFSLKKIKQGCKLTALKNTIRGYTGREAGCQKTFSKK